MKSFEVKIKVSGYNEKHCGGCSHLDNEGMGWCMVPFSEDQLQYDNGYPFKGFVRHPECIDAETKESRQTISLTNDEDKE